MENPNNSNNKNSNRKWKFFKFAPILAGSLFFMNPSWADAENASNHTRTKAEVSTSTILDRLNQKIWVSLSDEYNYKVLDFVLNDTIMRTRSATAYTEEFIVNEMKKDRWISKQNQLLFIRSTIYAWISKKPLYDRLDDDNETRSDEYEKALKQINSSYEEYKKWFKTYMETKSAKYDRRSADAQQRSGKAIKEIMKQDSTRVKERMTEFYDLYIQNPNNIKQDDLNFMKKSTKEFIADCKKHWIDYRAILLKEVWDKRKVDAILKFYGIE